MAREILSVDKWKTILEQFDGGFGISDAGLGRYRIERFSTPVRMLVHDASNTVVAVKFVAPIQSTTILSHTYKPRGDTANCYMQAALETATRAPRNFKMAIGERWKSDDRLKLLSRLISDFRLSPDVFCPERRELAVLVREIIEYVPSKYRLLDELGNVIVATNLEAHRPCLTCGNKATPVYGRSVSKAVTLVDGKISEDASGMPLVSEQERCDQCTELPLPSLPVRELISEYRDSRNSFKRPLQPTETTYGKWPFHRTVGLELEGVVVTTFDAATLVKGLGWSIVGDSSVRDLNQYGFTSEAVEFNTRGSAGDWFYNHFTSGMAIIEDAIRVNASCGLHVHIGWENLDRVQKANVQNFLVAMQPLIYSLQPKSRQSNSYCKKIVASSQQIATPDQLFRPDTFGDSKYMGISFMHGNGANIYADRNTNGTGGYGTLEFRMGAGSRNTVKILNWVQFLHRLIDIGSEFKDDNYFRNLRAMPVPVMFAVFKDLAERYDALTHRPPEFLSALLPWMQERMLKFNPSLTFSEAPMQLNVSSIRDQINFAQAKLVTVTGVEERFENSILEGDI